MKVLHSMAMLLFVFISLSTLASPVFPDIEGWQKGEIKTYNTETLWEYINGAADYYLTYSFEKLELLEYAKSDDQYIKAEIYHHTNPINAFGIYAFERPADGEFITLGIEAYMAPSITVFYIDKYYVKVLSHHSASETLEAINSIARLIATNLSENPEIPDELSLLPLKNQLAHSSKYIPANFLGYSFFTDVVTAKYTLAGNTIDFFCISYESDEAAMNILLKYISTLNLDISASASKVIELSDMFNGPVSLFIKNKQLFGVYNYKDADAAKDFLLRSAN
jgi:hypothetical protein